MGKSTIGKGTNGKALIRCAIYTRKSSEDGLEQDFNSLDAQRESCEAFILSQKHEGWTALPGMYDDGGLSGGTLERPALKRILADIEGHRIDTVVVYKVDRLTRSLGDFAKIVEIFDKRKVSFVSVTQQFNTTTSMGRLTLNMLLSFAQFEREVTGERIRDKIAASKKKGMWMGGNVPLGYVVKDRKLLIDEAAAKMVRHIYRRYLTLGSVRILKEELERDGVVDKVRVDRYGRATGGKPLARGALYTMLQNRIYRGRIVHKDKHYPGAHEAIVDESLWDAVQRQLAANRIACATGTHAAEPSLLAGLIYDDGGQRMTPSHANKKGTRYRYYVSQANRRPPRGLHGAGACGSVTARNGPVPDHGSPVAGTPAAKASPSSATPDRARCRCPRSSPPGASGNSARAAPRARPSWLRNRAGSSPRQRRRSRPRSAPTASGHKTHDPESAASPTSSPSGLPDHPSAVPSPSANPPANQGTRESDGADLINGLL